GGGGDARRRRGPRRGPRGGGGGAGGPPGAGPAPRARRDDARRRHRQRTLHETRRRERDDRRKNGARAVEPRQPPARFVPAKPGAGERGIEAARLEPSRRDEAADAPPDNILELGASVDEHAPPRRRVLRETLGLPAAAGPP